MRKEFHPKTVISIIYVTAMFMAAMDGTIVNVALSTISREFGISPSATSSLNISYITSLAVILPLSGWLGDRFGTKQIFILALSLFTGASILCGLSNSLGALNVSRILQGIGGGLLTPVGMAMLFRTFSKEERARASRSLLLPIAVAPAIGPVVGGLLVDMASWRWIFYINVPFGLFTIIFALLFLKEHKEQKAGKFDALGFLLSAPGLCFLLYALIEAPSKGLSPVVLITGIAGLVLLTFFVLLELKIEQPMLFLRLLAEDNFKKMCMISFLASGGLLGMLYVFPLMYQGALGASALESGTVLFPEALGLMLASRLVPFSNKKWGAKNVISTGLLVAALLFVLLSFAGSIANPWVFRIILFGIGVSLGHAVVTVQFTSFANVSSSSMGRATTLFQVQNRLGSSIGLAVLAGIIALFQFGSSSRESLLPYQASLGGAALILFIAFLVSLTVGAREKTTVKHKKGAELAQIKK
jgi:EmrB/QacA subfamily drug resistance transporter